MDNIDYTKNKKIENGMILILDPLKFYKPKVIKQRKGDTIDIELYYEPSIRSTYTTNTNKNTINQENGSDHLNIEINKSKKDGLDNASFKVNNSASKLHLEKVEKDKYDNKELNENNNADNSLILNNSTIMKKRSSVLLGDDDNKPNKKKLSCNKLFHFEFPKSYFPRDQNHPFIYSFSEFQPISFMSGQTRTGLNKKKMLDFPSPTYIPHNEFIKGLDVVKKEEILKSFRIDDKMGLVLIDTAVSNKFKGIVGDIMYSLFKSLILGKPISLPVRIFEPKSTLQRICELWCFAPSFLKSASEQNKNPLERMKLTISYAIAGLYVSTKQLKPFNPLLGETFEGHIDNNIFFYAEHIGHYPTVARFLIMEKDKKFRVSGYYDFTTKSGKLGSNLRVYQRGPHEIMFANKETITYNMPVLKLINCKTDKERSSQFKSKMIFVDPANSLKAIVYFSKNPKKINDIQGFIQKYKFPKDYKFDHVKELGLTKGKNIDKDVICKLNGNWLQNLKFDEVEYWSVDKHVPDYIIPKEDPLPFDGRYREDLIWLFRSFNATSESDKNKFEEYSQEWKMLMEIVQRYEREQRKKLKKIK